MIIVSIIIVGIIVGIVIIDIIIVIDHTHHIELNLTNTCSIEEETKGSVGRG